LALTHTQRWRAHSPNFGMGHLYQGRFKSFVVQKDEPYVRVCRYVEGNALRAGLVQRAEEWRFGSLWRRGRSGDGLVELTEGPVALPEGWIEEVNRPHSEPELAALRRSVQRGQPYGEESWVRRVAGRMGLESTLRPRGRPAKVQVESAKPGVARNKGS
jgi:putative transposase